MTLVRCEGTEFCDVLLLINWISLVKAGLENNVHGDHEVIQMYYIRGFAGNSDGFRWNDSTGSLSTYKAGC